MGKRPFYSRGSKSLRSVPDKADRLISFQRDTTKCLLNQVSQPVCRTFKSKIVRIKRKIVFGCKIIIIIHVPNRRLKFQEMFSKHWYLIPRNRAAIVWGKEIPETIIQPFRFLKI